MNLRQKTNNSKKNTQGKGGGSLVSFTAGFILVWLIGYLLIVGRGLLIPLVIALFIWNLLNTIDEGIGKLPWMGVRLPHWLRHLFSLCVIILMIKALILIITNNVNDVILASARYQDNLNLLLNHIDQQYRLKFLAGIENFMHDLNVQDALAKVYGVFTMVTSSAVLIFLYVVFLFVEQHFFRAKMMALFPNKAHRKIIDNIFSHMLKDIQTYLGLKTLLSFLTAFASWVVMKLVGLDFAAFWALLIFFLSFIPNIGAIVATIFPALLAFIQFQSWMPFIFVTLGIVVIQFIIGNLLEPRFLSKSLNLSPFVILLSLALWGAIWGILGMFLSVPITVMMLIVFAHFESTRPFAILLSKDGRVHQATEPLQALEKSA